MRDPILCSESFSPYKDIVLTIEQSGHGYIVFSPEDRNQVWVSADLGGTSYYRCALE